MKRFNLAGEAQKRVIHEFKSKLSGKWRECHQLQRLAYQKYGYETRIRYANEWPD